MPLCKFILLGAKKFLLAAGIEHRSPLKTILGNKHSPFELAGPGLLQYLFFFKTKPRPDQSRCRQGSTITAPFILNFKLNIRIDIITDFKQTSQKLRRSYLSALKME